MRYKKNQIGSNFFSSPSFLCVSAKNPAQIRYIPKVFSLVAHGALVDFTLISTVQCFLLSLLLCYFARLFNFWLWWVNLHVNEKLQQQTPSAVVWAAPIATAASAAWRWQQAINVCAVFIVVFAALLASTALYLSLFLSPVQNIVSANQISRA